MTPEDKPDDPRGQAQTGGDQAQTGGGQAQTGGGGMPEVGAE
jgi:hypothetical protein